MMQRCRQPLLLLGLTAVLVIVLGKAAEATGEDALGVKNLTGKALQIIPYHDNSTNVTQLVVERNQITLNETDQQALASYPALAELHLDGNQVTAVPDKYFSVVPHLRVLSLSRNSISRLEPEAFFGLDVLTELDLSNNRLTSLPTQLLGGIKHLQKLNLQKNPWNCSCPLLSIIGAISAANITIGAPGVTCASPEVLAGKDILEATSVCYPSPSPSLSTITDPQEPVTTRMPRTSSTTGKTSPSPNQNHSLNNNQTPVLGNTWKFTACVSALALTTATLVVCAIKGPSWYKLFHNYRHRRLDAEDEEDDDIAPTDFSEIGRYHSHQTFTFEPQNGREAEEEEDGYFEDPYIKREE